MPTPPRELTQRSRSTGCVHNHSPSLATQHCSNNDRHLFTHVGLSFTMLSSKHQPLVVCYALVLVLLISATAVNSFHIWPVTNGFLKTTSKRYDSISNTSYCLSKLGTRIYSDNTRGANGKTKFGQKVCNFYSYHIVSLMCKTDTHHPLYQYRQIQKYHVS